MTIVIFSVFLVVSVAVNVVLFRRVKQFDDLLMSISGMMSKMHDELMKMTSGNLLMSSPEVMSVHNMFVSFAGRMGDIVKELGGKYEVEIVSAEEKED